MSKILFRIQQIAQNEGITIGALERVIGASKGVLSRAIANGTDIQSKWLQILVDNYPKYSAEWIISGKGQMIKDTIKESIAKEPAPVYGEINNPFYQLYKEKDQEVNRLNQEIGALKSEVEHLKNLLRQSNMSSMIDLDVEGAKKSVAG